MDKVSTHLFVSSGICADILGIYDHTLGSLPVFPFLIVHTPFLCTPQSIPKPEPLDNQAGPSNVANRSSGNRAAGKGGEAES